MAMYRIAKFDEVFTKSDARKSSVLHWVSMPTAFHSNGYQSLVEDFGDEAPAIYGAWCALVAVAARCPTPGVLSTSRGRPITAERAANMAYMPAEPFRKLLEWASSESVGWIEVTEHPETHRDDSGSAIPTAVGAPSRLHNNTLHNNTGQDISCPAEPDVCEPTPKKRKRKTYAGEHPGFRQWYEAYPLKAAPEAASKAYAKAVRRVQGRDGPGADDPVAYLLDRAKAYAESDIGKGEKQYIKQPAGWLNDSRFDDDPLSWVRKEHSERQPYKPSGQVATETFRARHNQHGNSGLRLLGSEPPVRSIRAPSG